MKDDIVIVSAARTPVGAFNGAFANLPAHELGKAAIKAAMDRAGVEGARVSEVILGQILTAGQGQNPARQASIAAAIPVETPAWGVNQLCGSGLRAVALGYQAILNGDSEIVVAGGQESMSMAPHCAHLRNGVKMGNFEMVDTMIKDGLWDAFNGYHMGNTAENVARQWQITREEQDKFATASQNKAEAARKAGKFKDEIAPVTVKTRKGETVVADDEYIREGAKVEDAAKLRPAFDKEGTVTAGNASQLSDGSAAVIVMEAGVAAKKGLAPLGRYVGMAVAGTEPAGIYISHDGGESWHGNPEVASLRDELGWSLPYSPEAGCVRGFAFHGERGYAAVEVGGVLITDDRGETWHLADSNGGNPPYPPPGAIHPDVHSIEVHPSSRDLVYAPTGGGFYRSWDGGKTWSLRFRGYCRAVWVDRDDPEHLMLGTAEGVDYNGRIELSRDGGRTWQLASGGLEVPWRHNMVERFAQVGDELLAVLSNGELIAAPLGTLEWCYVLKDHDVNAITSLTLNS